MFYYRTNREQIGKRNTLQPATRIHGVHRQRSERSRRHGAEPEADARRRSTTSIAAANALRATSATTRTILDTDLQGRRVHGDQALHAEVADAGGLHDRQERGRAQLDGRTDGTDLNDPEQHALPEGIIGNDSETAFRLSGSYTLPYEINVAGSMIANNGYPYVSTYS